MHAVSPVVRRLLGERVVKLESLLHRHILKTQTPDFPRESQGFVVSAAWKTAMWGARLRKYPLRASRFAYTRSMAGVLQKINLSPFPILYMTDAAQNEADVDSLRKALKDSKGPGNFHNLFVYSPNGKKDGLQIIPVSEVTAKDEFNSIKNQTRDDVLASLRIPPQLMGIVPQNAGGFGSIREAAQIYAANELEPIQARMAQVNEWLGEEVVRFNPYAVPAGA